MREKKREKEAKESKWEAMTQEKIEEIKSKIISGIREKIEQNKKDRSIKVDTMTRLFVRITFDEKGQRYFITISPRGGHPVWNKVVFDSSEKIKEFIGDLQKFVDEREDVIVAIDELNKEAKGEKVI